MKEMDMLINFKKKRKNQLYEMIVYKHVSLQAAYYSIQNRKKFEQYLIYWGKASEQNECLQFYVIHSKDRYAIVCNAYRTRFNSESR